MTKQELCSRFICETKLVDYLEQVYDAPLRKQLSGWLKNPGSYDSVIRSAVVLFCERLTSYWSATDCFYAIVGCMHEVFAEALLDGTIEANQCTELAKNWYSQRSEIRSIPVKQMNLILSEFSREMFDYFVDRYYFLKDTPYNSRIEKKLARKFAGKGSLKVLYEINHFQKPTCSPEAYFEYARLTDPYFIQQIGLRKKVDSHPDSLQHYTLQRTVNPARWSIIAVGILFLVLLILAYLSSKDMIPI